MEVSPGRRTFGTPREWLALIALVGAILVCPREVGEEPADVVSLSLACEPARSGVQCKLLALSRGGTQAPRDVTPRASWRGTGRAEIHLLPSGALQATGAGDVIIDTRYASKSARVTVRLAPGRPAQLLATVRGTVYAYACGGLRRLANARVEVIGGSSDGTFATTRGDGSYMLPPVDPGGLVIRASKPGFIPTDLSGQIQPGDNRVNPVITVEPPTSLLTL